MDPMPTKKMLIINILEILQKYSDVNHRLTQQDIIKKLADEYNMTVDRKAVKRNIMKLIDAGYDIEYTEAERIGKTGEKEILYTDWYYNRKFEDSELRLLIDSLLFSKHIPYSQCKELIEKIKGLSSVYFDAKVRHIVNLPENMPTNKQLFYNIECIDEAIEKGKQVLFKYAYYDIDKKLHIKSDNSIPREYLVNPYQIVATNARYYLIGNYDKYDDVSHYRLDRIVDIEVTDNAVKPMRKVKGLENGLNLPTHMAEHIYMFSGNSIRATFKAKRYLVNEIIDWFGMDTVFSNETVDDVLVTVKVNENAIFYWLLQYGQHVEILQPNDLRNRVVKTFSEIGEKYKQEVK